MKTLKNIVKSGILAAGILASAYSTNVQKTIDSSDMKMDTAEIDVGAITIDVGESYKNQPHYTINDIESIGSVSQKTFTIGIDVDSIYLDGAPIGQNQPHYTVDNFELLNNIFVDDASSRGLTFNSGISSLEEKTMLFGQDSLIRNEPNESMNGNFNVIRYDSVTSVPEPSTLALGSIALALAYSIRRKR